MVRSRRHPEFIGQTITQIAYWKGSPAFEIVADLIAEEGNDVGISMGPFSPEDVKEAIVQPWVALSTDGALVPLGQGYPHPRSYGSYARVVEHYVRELGLLTLEDAVRKSTSLPAQILGLRDRGTLREGAWADITIFDPARVHNRSTYEDPHQYAEGFDIVLVNGVVVLENGATTGATPGRVLRHRLPDLGPGPRQASSQR